MFHPGERKNAGTSVRAYNFAQTVFDEWTSSMPHLEEPLDFEAFDSESDSDSEPDADMPSESEELPDLDEDDDKENLDPDDVDSYRFPGYLDRCIFRFRAFQPVKTIMNKVDRKAYLVLNKRTGEPQVIIVAEDLDLKSRGPYQLPRELRVLKRVRGLDNVVEALGWCQIDRKRYAFLTPMYLDCDMVACTGFHYPNEDASSVKGNLALIQRTMRSLLTAVAQIHERKVCHRDIAIENMLWDPVAESVRLIDFDTATFFRPGGYYRYVGRDDYSSPEKALLRDIREEMWQGEEKRAHRQRPYNESADLYAVGIVMFMLLKQKRESPRPKVVRKYVRKVKDARRHKKYPELDLLLKLLAHKPERRPTAEEALEHEFFDQEYANAEAEYAEMKGHLDKMVESFYQEHEEERSDSDSATGSDEDEDGDSILSELSESDSADSAREPSDTESDSEPELEHKRERETKAETKTKEKQEESKRTLVDNQDLLDPFAEITESKTTEELASKLAAAAVMSEPTLGEASEGSAAELLDKATTVPLPDDEL